MRREHWKLCMKIDWHRERSRPPDLILEFYYHCCCFVFSLGPFDGNSRYGERWVDIASQCQSSVALYASQARYVHNREFVLPVLCGVTLHRLYVAVVAWHENLIVFPVSLFPVLTYLLVFFFFGGTLVYCGLKWAYCTRPWRYIIKVRRWKLKCCEKNLPHFHFVNHKSLELNSGRRGQKLANNLLNYVMLCVARTSPHGLEPNVLLSMAVEPLWDFASFSVP
jgi:hypothetical protein